MANYYDEIPLNYTREDTKIKLIVEIMNFIKFKQDYDSAIKIIIENNLKIIDIVNLSCRLTKQQIVEIANRLISDKNNR